MSTIENLRQDVLDARLALREACQYTNTTNARLTVNEALDAEDECYLALKNAEEALRQYESAPVKLINSLDIQVGDDVQIATDLFTTFDGVITSITDSRIEIRSANLGGLKKFSKHDPNFDWYVTVH